MIFLNNCIHDSAKSVFRKQGMKKQYGMALVMVLWIISLLTIMAGSYALTIRREISVVSAIKNNAELLALAEAGLNVAAVMLFYQEKDKQWRGDSSIYSFNFQGAEIRLRIFSESGKVDINQANEQLLLDVLKNTSANESQQQALVSAILDWRDTDDLVRINGAEASQYSEAGLAYQPANTRFQAVEELQLVLGMDEEIYQQLEPLVTTYSRQATVNLALASREVIMAISTVDAALLEEFIQQRQESNRLHIAAPDFPLQGGGAAVNNSGFFTVFAEARAADKTKAGIRATISKAVVANKQTAFKQKLFIVSDWKIMLDEKDSLFTEGVEQILFDIDAET